MSTIIALLPNLYYVTPMANPHVTLGYFGEVADWDAEQMKSDIQLLAHGTRPIPAFTDCRSIFSSDPEYVVHVDLITAFPLTELRSKIERLYGNKHPMRKVRLDMTYGFIPHMTLGKVGDPEVDAHLNDPMLLRQEFTLNRLALWHGDDRTEITL